MEMHPQASSPTFPASVVVADDHPLLRQALRQSLEAAGLTVIGEAPDGIIALELIAEFQPDLLVLDIDMPRMNGLSVLRALQGHATPKVICLSLHNAEDLVAEAFSLGAAAFLLKQSAIPEIQAGVREVAAGRQYLSPALSQHFQKHTNQAQNAGASSEQLTPMEKRVLRGVASDKSSKEIAEQLNIHFRTVENYRTAICRKLGLSGANALLRYALQHRQQL
jgi:DNA-binding NarL/FixJ family response regulator